MDNTSGRLAPVTPIFGGAATPAAAQATEAAATAGSVIPTRSGPRFEDLSRALIGTAPTSIVPGDGAADDAEDDGEATDFDPVVEAEEAHDAALRALTRKGLSVSELRSWLKSRDFDELIVDEEVERLIAVGLLDDAALAETLVRSLQERKGLGRSGVSNELRKRGIDQAAISIALETDDDGDDEAARALEIAVKRAGQLSSYDHETAKRRLSGFLMRRGYSGQVVSNAVNAALEGTGRPSRGGSRGGSNGRGPRFS